MYSTRTTDAVCAVFNRTVNLVTGMISAVLALDISATYRAILLQVAVEMEEVVFFLLKD